MGSVAEEEHENRSKIFTYGTLKKGFSNHKLMEELIQAGDAWYVGSSCRTVGSYPLVCGPYRVPFLLNMPGRGQTVFGELYEVSPVGLARMDELEGVSRGHYQRLPIRVFLNTQGYDAEAYFAHTSYADDLWRKSGEKGYVIYSHNEAVGYVKRGDRPQHLSFLDHISIFLSSATESPPPPLPS